MDETTQALAERWGFAMDEELPGGHCSHVYANADRVLKAPFRGEEMVSGYVASLAMSGVTGPLVFEGDPSTGTVLMERLRPGTSLEQAALPEEEALTITAGLIRSVSVGSTEGLMPLADYFEKPDPLLSELLETAPDPVFLHGDLHHANVLRHGDRWIVIDPKGLVGDPAFEPTAFMRNPLGQLPGSPDLAGLLRRRIDLFASLLNLSAWRICAWSLVDTRSWADDEAWLRVVRVLEELESDLRP